MKHNAGYTLLEMSIVLGLVSALFLMSGTVMIKGMQVVATQNAFADVSEALRMSSLTLTSELASAVLDDVPGVNTVKGLSIGGTKADSLVFQRPLGLDGLTFSSPVTLRVRNEDTNGNLTLDTGEDLDKNGVLDRVLERTEDTNGDGKFDQPGETRILARNIDSATFDRQPGSHKITVTVNARSSMKIGATARTLAKQAQFTVFVRN